ncbi:MAG: hypothetical protein OXU62_00675 [Gammaproteobacteria bacterium]|nr:hypothetical protein [Gammaproteobacteria bacterium]
MDKFTEYLSVKIGIIVTGVYVMLNVYFQIQNAFVAFALATLISLALWLAVWDFAAAGGMPAYKRRMIFAIHATASVVPPAIGVFYVNYIANAA